MYYPDLVVRVFFYILMMEGELHLFIYSRVRNCVLVCVCCVDVITYWDRVLSLNLYPMMAFIDLYCRQGIFFCNLHNFYLFMEKENLPRDSPETIRFSFSTQVNDGDEEYSKMDLLRVDFLFSN